MPSKYPVIGSPVSDPFSKDWSVTIERGPEDAITKIFPNRTTARAAAKEWRAVAKLLMPRGGAVVVGPLPKVEAPRSRKDLVDLLSRTIALSQAGEIPHNAVAPIIQLAKLQLKLLDMKDPEDDLTGLSEEEILDRIFAQLTTEELLELAMERLSVRRAEIEEAA